MKIKTRNFTHLDYRGLEKIRERDERKSLLAGTNSPSIRMCEKLFFPFRYPKWSQTFENQLSFEFKTKCANALLLYTDDGALHANFYALAIVDAHVQLAFR